MASLVITTGPMNVTVTVHVVELMLRYHVVLLEFLILRLHSQTGTGGLLKETMMVMSLVMKLL